MFIACSRRIRFISKTADELEPIERITKIAQLFSTFKNPDKETVLTPWRVINIHLSQTLGGYSFYDEKFEYELEEPRYVSYENVTNDTLCNPNANILEINSKTGLYPLYVAYSIYRTKCDSYNKDLSFDEKLEIWDEVINNNIYVICKTKMAKLITRRTLLGYRKGRINAHAFDDLINQMREKQNQLVKNLKSSRFWNKGDNKEMKFNAVVGNPPYQISDGGAQASATPVYNYFVDTSKMLNPNYISLIMPSRWMTGGKGLDSFRKTMINDKHIVKLFDYTSSKDVFSSVDIKGGVCIFLRNNLLENKCEIHTVTIDGESISYRYLSNELDDIYIRDNMLLEIKDQVHKGKVDSFATIVSARKPYGLEAETMVKATKYGLPEFSTLPLEDSYRILGLGEGQKRMWKYLQKNYPIPKYNSGLNKYKVFIAEAYGCGAIGEVVSTPVLSTPVLSTPGELCTETFLQIGPFETLEETKNCIKYIKTKFFRLLVGIRKQTQHTTQKVYFYVPLQNFTNNSDIDWSKSIPEIDRQLYKKYSLTEDEIDFIETKVKPME